jgi:hypothetical protein
VSRAVRLAAWALLCAALSVYSVRGLDFSTDILNFMPDGHGAELAQISRELAHSDLARTMVLTLTADEPARSPTAGCAHGPCVCAPRSHSPCRRS